MGQFHKAQAGIDHIERLGRRTSCIHSLHPAAKALVTLAFIMLSVSMPAANVSALVPFVLYPALLAPLAGIPYKALLSRLPAALPFALAGGLSNIIFMREPLFTLGIAGGFVVTTGLVSFFSILLKTCLCVFAALFLIATTPFSVLAECLTAPRFLRPFGLQLVLTYRYIGALLDEARDMWTAYTLRAPQSRAVAMADFGAFLGQLLLRSFERARNVYNAMRCRGFAGRYYGPPPQKFRAADLIFAGASIAALCVLRFFNVSQALGRIFV